MTVCCELTDASVYIAIHSSDPPRALRVHVDVFVYILKRFGMASRSHICTTPWHTFLGTHFLSFSNEKKIIIVIITIKKW